MAGDFVNAVDPDGKPVKLPAENAAAAFQDGFRPESAAETKEREDAAKYDSPGTAALAGAARGATLGLSDVALTKTGLVNPETLQGLEKYNPKSSLAGEVGGTVATALIPGLGEASAGGLAARAAGAAERLGARALGGAAESALGKVALKAAGPAVEGGIFGLGSAVSEDVLEDGNVDLAAEKYLSHVGMGAVLGGALGAGTKVLGGAKDLALEKLLGKAAPAAEEAATEAGTAGAAEGGAATEQAAAGAATAAPAAPAKPSSGLPGIDVEDIPDSDAKLEQLAEKHAPTIKGVFERMGLEFPDKSNLVYRDLDLRGKAQYRLKEKGIYDEGARLLLDSPEAYGKARSMEEKLSIIQGKRDAAAKAIGEHVAKLDEVAKPGQGFDPVAAASRIDDEVIEPLKRGTAQNDTIVEKVRAESRRLRQLAQQNGGELSLQQAEELKRSYDAHINWNPLGSNEEKASAKALKKVRGILNSEIEAKARGIAESTDNLEAFDAWKQAKRTYGTANEVSNLFERRIADRQGNRLASASDYGVGSAVGLLTGGPLGFVTGVGGAIANKWARERLPQVMALYLDKMEQSGGMRVAAQGFKSFFDKAESASLEAQAKAPASAVADAATSAAVPVPGATGASPAGAAASVGAPAAPAASALNPFGKYAQALSAAASKGANVLFATHAALAATDPAYREQMKQAGLDELGPEASRATMAKAHQLAALQAQNQKHDAQVQKAIEGVLAGAKAKAAARGKGPEFQVKLDELAQLAADPTQLLQRMQVSPGLAQVAPNVAGAAALAATRAVQYLQGLAPKSPSPPTLPGFGPEWKPSDTERAAWERTVAAVENPTSVLQDMQRGTVTKEAVAALQAVYPQLHAELQQRFIQALSAKKASLSYQQRLSIARLFGGSIEPTMAPGAVSAFQAVHSSPEIQDPRQGGGSGRPMKLQDSSTQSQRVERGHR